MLATVASLACGLNLFIYLRIAYGFFSSLQQMYRFTIHVVQTSKTQPSLWVPSAYTFGHNNLEICMSWVNQINFHLHVEAKRPKNLLVRDNYNFANSLKF